MLRAENDTKNPHKRKRKKKTGKPATGVLPAVIIINIKSTLIMKTKQNNETYFKNKQTNKHES